MHSKFKATFAWIQNIYEDMMISYTHFTPDQVPLVDGRGSQICYEAPLLLFCSFVCGTTEAPSNLPPPTCCCSGSKYSQTVRKGSINTLSLHFNILLPLIDFRKSTT